MRVFTSAASLAAALLLAGSGAAQGTPTVVPTIGFDLITGRIQDVAAERAGTGTRAWGGQVNGGITAYRVLSLSADFGIVDMRDGRQFTQPTDRGDMSSAVSSFLGTLAVGLRTPNVALGGSNPVLASVGVNAGHTWITTRRAITNCVDCHSEDVELRAGNFLEPSLQLGRGRGGLTARYRVYQGDSNWENALMVGYTWIIQPRAKKTREETAPEDTQAEP